MPMLRSLKTRIQLSHSDMLHRSAMPSLKAMVKVHKDRAKVKVKARGCKDPEVRDHREDKETKKKNRSWTLMYMALLTHHLHRSRLRKTRFLQIKIKMI